MRTLLRETQDIYAEFGRSVSKSLGRVHPLFQLWWDIYTHEKKVFRACLERSRALNRGPVWSGIVMLGKNGADKS